MPAHLQRLLAPLHQTRTYTRWVYLILGGTAFVPYLTASVVVVFLAIGQGRPPASNDAFTTTEGLLGLLASAALTLALVAATALIPGARGFVAHITATLVGGPLTPHPGPSRGGRARTAGWLLIHLPTGFAVCLLTMIALTEAASFVTAPLTGWSPAQEGMFRLLLLIPDDTPLLPLVGLGEVAGLLYLIAALGALLARLAPRLLGPSPTERLSALQARADSLAERNRLARELHDSIGHALSVVALQAGAAARVIDADPAFARTALAAIADQARTATAELDHVLGLLRENRPNTAPTRTLTDLDSLVRATRAAGTDIRARLSGDPAHVPGVVARETYRICQEGLTNALRHAHGAPVTLDVDITTDRLRVRVTNPLRGATTRRTRGGRGLAGIGERVRLLGGSVWAGPHDGDWTLTATITWKGRQP